MSLRPGSRSALWTKASARTPDEGEAPIGLLNPGRFSLDGWERPNSSPLGTQKRGKTMSQEEIRLTALASAAG